MQQLIQISQTKTVSKLLTIKNCCIPHLHVNTYFFNFYSINQEFNFEITNEYIDYYIMDMLPGDTCDNETKLTGQVPIDSCDQNVTSMVCFLKLY
jgi:hypothetical protein